MKLAEKGRFAPPPVLPPHAQAVSEAIAAWPGVHARTHWLLGDEQEVDGADFYLGEEELGHIHLDGEAHIAFSKPLRDALIAAGLAKPFRWSAKFVMFRIQTLKDRAHAESLFSLSYQRLQGASDAQLLKTLGISSVRSAAR
ncbi:MAG: luciferase family protein [Myxococcales bacterium]